MRVVALGGCGAMGRYAVRTALNHDAVEEIVVADLDEGRAAAFAEQCGARTTHAQVDLEDEAALGRLLAGAGAVLNTTGPYYRFGVRVLRAAIAARCHYLDLCDDWQPTLEMLELDGEARAAGTTAIVGMGASPGVSNLLAAAAMRELEQVNGVITGWSLEAARPDAAEERAATRAAKHGPGAAMSHIVKQLIGTIRIRRSGEFTDAKPLERVDVNYPGIGTALAWTVGHPEAVTLPRYRPEMFDCLNVFTAAPGTTRLVRWICGAVDAGWLKVETAAKLLDWLEGRADYKGVPEYGRVNDRIVLPPLFAVARGRHEGQAATVGALVTGAPPGAMGGATGVPLGAALGLLAQGVLDRPGVHAPEDIIEPRTFFDTLGPLCAPPKAGYDDLVQIARSWEIGA